MGAHQIPSAAYPHRGRARHRQYSGANAIGGDNDTAILFGNLTGNFAGVEAGNPGNSDFALAIGNENGSDDGPYAGEGHNNIAIDIGNETGDNLGANASPSAGSFDFAGIFGNNDTATAGSPRRFRPRRGFRRPQRDR